jgi:putative protease
MCPELLAPAGSFDAGYYALQNGADALYLGLSAFSARRAAKNFSMDQFARIKAFAESQGGRVYAALNTLIKDEELPAAAEILYDLAALNVDGVIIQDFGLLDLMRKNFPRVPVHASTQMGVHNTAGVQALAALGVRRVILSRELTAEELIRIRRDCPDVELEVFIHGALCYSFSGLCLASGMLLGRSGNRGDCAQICRGWFEAAEGGERAYFFSRTDLALGDYILRLRDMGINALKIEGRMKPPAWVAAVTACYRAILDGKPRKEWEAPLEKSRVIFSRRAGTGFLEGENKDTIDSAYPGHIGVPAGRVQARKTQGAEKRRGDSSVGKGFFLKLETSLAVRDCLLYFTQGAGAAGLPAAHSLSVTALLRGGKKTSFAEAGEPVFIPGPEIPAGTEVRKIFAHDTQLPDITQKLPRKRMALRLGFRLSPRELAAAAESPDGLFETFYAAFPVQPEAAKTRRAFTEIAAAYLRPPESSRFEAQNLDAANQSGFPEDGVYINPGVLKEIRRDLYARLETHYTAARQAAKNRALTDGVGGAEISGRSPSGSETDPAPRRFPPRALLEVRRGHCQKTRTLPFAADPQTLSLEDLYADEAGRVYLPLAPVLFGRADAYLDSAAAFVRRSLEEKPGIRFMLGLCNPGHFRLAEIFAAENRVSFFIDYGLYCANRRAAAFFARSIPRLEFYYPWVEDLCTRPRTEGLPAAEYGRFRPPLFIGRGDAGPSRAPVRLRQGKKTFIMQTAHIADALLEMLFWE